MKTVFLGTGTFAAPILEKMALEKDWEILLVVVQPPKPAGRGRKETASPIETKARELGLDVFTPKTLRDVPIQKKILSCKPEIIITAAYGKIIPREIFDAPKHKTVNVHPSLLPKLRGPSPIQWALLEGANETGVSLMLIDEELDQGPIISQETCALESHETYEMLEMKLANLGAEMAVRDIPRYVAGEITPWEQNHSEATYSKMIKKEDGRVDWSRPARDIYNRWRAFIRWPGIFTFADSMRLNLEELNLSKNLSNTSVGQIGSEPGRFFQKDGRLFAVCGDGAIEILKIQPEGKRIMAAREFINGHRQILDKNLG